MISLIFHFTTNRSDFLQIIDFHTHVYPDAIAHKAAQSIRDFYEIGDTDLDGTVDLLLQSGKEAGISRYIILPVGLKPNGVSRINDFIYQQVQVHPEFTGFGTLHAGMDDLTEECERAMNLGLRGFKMHPDSQEFSIDDPRLFPAYEMLQGRAPVILHMGDTRYDHSHPRRLRHVLDLFPNLEVIAAHFGGYSMYETAYDLLHDKDCIFDVSSSMMFMEEGIAEKYINIYGAERMAFGTDYPLWDPVAETKRFLQLKLTDEQFDQIGHKTVERILNL